MSEGRSIRLFLVDGTPTGLLTAEIPNWTGHVLVAPRNRLSEALLRQESGKTGVYFLIGEEDGRTKVYVGEGDCIRDRIKQHARDSEKDFWERVCFVTSKDPNLTKAHVRYLESRLVSLIRESGRAEVANYLDPAAGSLPEADKSDMEAFLEQLQILIPTVGLDFLRQRPLASLALAQQTTSASAISARVYLQLRQQGGVDARAFEADGELIVLKGSRGTSQQFAVNGYARLRDGLVESGKLEKQPDGSMLFTDDVPFASPSAAAAVVLNRQAAGPRVWKLEGTDQSLKEWRESLLL